MICFCCHTLRSVILIGWAVSHFIYDEITQFTTNAEYYYNAINQLLLRMLLAFDEKSNVSLLDCTIKIADWLRTADLSKKRNIAIDDLNYLQAIKRKRKFTAAEIEVLHNILDNNSSDWIILTGTYILLDEYERTQEMYNNLSDTDKLNFNQYPIANLWSYDVKPEIESGKDISSSPVSV